MRFHPCTTLCIGTVQVQPGRFDHAEDVASAAAAAKRAAKHGKHGVVTLDEWVGHGMGPTPAYMNERVPAQSI